MKMSSNGLWLPSTSRNGTDEPFLRPLWGADCPGERRARKIVHALRKNIFPRISPAIIVCIERGDEILLARSSRFAQGFYSVLAGFVEAGESLEETVRREVEEETGIIVTDIRYFGSQPWPFPDSLMLGFTARYESGDLRIDGKEIVDAGWFRVDNLPETAGEDQHSKAADRLVHRPPPNNYWGLAPPTTSKARRASLSARRLRLLL